MTTGGHAAGEGSDKQTKGCACGKEGDPPGMFHTMQMSWCSTADIGNVAAAVIAAGRGKYGGKTVRLREGLVLTLTLATSPSFC